jgi:hypothetical protein
MGRPIPGPSLRPSVRVSVLEVDRLGNKVGSGGRSERDYHTLVPGTIGPAASSGHAPLLLPSPHPLQAWRTEISKRAVCARGGGESGSDWGGSSGQEIKSERSNWQLAPTPPRCAPSQDNKMTASIIGDLEILSLSSQGSATQAADPQASSAPAAEPVPSGPSSSLESEFALRKATRARWARRWAHSA